MSPIGAISLAWMSNVLLRDPDERLPVEEDLIATLRLGAQFSVGDGDSLLMFRLVPGMQALRLDELKRFDSTSPTFDADARYEDGVLKVALTP